ncbi:hypothetical protein OBBRIDRAFT_807352 [Obba rivulosa]|uniref:Uncharacterized protein n=1 Tax=Obba rivulosa TaxID=1052685 RepID=A0A8E2AUN4_9APHY|nr:hypothetical protein OBBRIDRAFT_807352 [Obba rivulosa]
MYGAAERSFNTVGHDILFVLFHQLNILGWVPIDDSPVITSSMKRQCMLLQMDHRAIESHLPPSTHGNTNWCSKPRTRTASHRTTFTNGLFTSGMLAQFLEQRYPATGLGHEAPGGRQPEQGKGYGTAFDLRDSHRRELHPHMRPEAPCRHNVTVANSAESQLFGPVYALQRCDGHGRFPNGASDSTISIHWSISWPRGPG